MYLIPYQERCQAHLAIACTAPSIFYCMTRSPRTSITPLVAGGSRQGGLKPLLSLSSYAQGQFFPSWGRVTAVFMNFLS